MSELQSIIDDFSYLDDWEDRYRYVIELGKALPELPESDRTEAHKVQGCVSQVWLVTEIAGGDSDDPVIVFRGDSDSHIVRGLVAIVLAASSGQKASAITALDEKALLAQLGLAENLTPQRANGLRSMIRRIKAEAAGAMAH